MVAGSSRAAGAVCRISVFLDSKRASRTIRFDSSSSGRNPLDRRLQSMGGHIKIDISRRAVVTASITNEAADELQLVKR